MSQANYVVICEGRIDLLNAGRLTDKLQAASSAASALVRHIDIMNPGKLKDADTKPVSDLQHYMMDNFHTMKAREVKEKCAEMFALLDALEDKF